MDFHTLNRKQLQALCKLNGIPANITNVAMADSLQALQHVEGLEDLLNQSPEKAGIGSTSVARTTARTTTTRRKAAVKEEPESSQPLTRTTRRAAVTKKTVAEDVDQEQTTAEVPPKTPAAPSTRRRAPATSARQKTEAQTETATAQQAYSTRRSVRLLGKTMSKMNLGEESSMASSIEELSTETTNVSEQCESSVVKGSNMQTESDVSSQAIDASEISSEPKSNGPFEGESLVKDSKDVGELQNDSVLKSEIDYEVSASKSASDVNMISEGMDESHEESLAEAEKTTEEPCDEGKVAEVAKESDEVNAAQSSVPKEVNDPISLNLSITLAEEQSKSSIIEESKEVPKAEALADYSEKFDFELDSATEGESDEEEEVNEGSFVLPNNKSDEMEASAEEDSEYESTEGEEEDSQYESTEGEEEDSDDDMSEEFSEDGAEEGSIADKSEKQCAERSLVSDSNMSEAAAQVSKASPCVSSLAAANEGTAQTSSPLPANIATQFPRPSAAKSPGKKQSEVAKYIYDDNEESFDSSNEVDKEEDLEGVEMMKNDENSNEKEETAQTFEAKSLRQLKKMLKEMTIKKDTKAVDDKPRIALKEVPENQMA